MADLEVQAPQPVDNSDSSGTDTASGTQDFTAILEALAERKQLEDALAERAQREAAFAAEHPGHELLSPGRLLEPGEIDFLEPTFGEYEGVNIPRQSRGL